MLQSQKTHTAQQQLLAMNYFLQPIELQYT